MSSFLQYFALIFVALTILAIATNVQAEQQNEESIRVKRRKSLKLQKIIVLIKIFSEEFMGPMQMVVPAADDQLAALAALESYYAAIRNRRYGGPPRWFGRK